MSKIKCCGFKGVIIMENKKQNIGIKLRNNLAELSDEIVRAKGRMYKELIESVDVSEDYSDGYVDIFGVIKLNERSQELVDTNVSIDIETNRIGFVDCDCPRFINNSMPKNTAICEHIAATVYNYIESVEKGTIVYPGLVDIINHVKKDNSKELLEILENNKLVAKELMKIEIFLLEKSEGIFEANFKIGDTKLYVLKNIIEFINAIDKKEELVFGKGFVYKPHIHQFSKEDNKIISFIREYAKVASVLNETTYDYGYFSGYRRSAPTKLVKNKSLILIDTALRRFLECTSHKKVNVELDGFKGTVDIIQDNIPIAFDIKENNEEIILSKNGNMPMPLISKGGVFLFNNNLYLPTQEQGERYLPFIKVFRNDEEVVYKKNKQKKSLLLLFQQ